MKTKYENSWDRYSREWKGDSQGGPHLGVEWGTDDFTRTIHEKFLAPLIDRDHTVLEIGPGGGKYSVETAPLCARLICADVSKEMLRRTEERLRGATNVELLKLDGLDLSGVEDESVDFAFSIDVFVHLDQEDIYGYLREFLRVLRPGGRVVLHLASMLTDVGWGQFVLEADFNRAQFKQIGRINFLAPEIAVRMLRGTGFEVEEVDTTTSPRDFLVIGRKPERIEDPGADARGDRIRKRAGGRGNVARDFLRDLPLAVKIVPAPQYVTGMRMEIDGDERDTLFDHPPALVGFPLTIPEGAVLVTSLAIHPKAWSQCCRDGIEFLVRLRTGRDEHVLLARTLDPAGRPEDRRWHDVRIPLDRHAGRVGFLTFQTRIARGANEFNWAGWGEPALLVSS
jgi:SAM-dependent methyltransferase